MNPAEVVMREVQRAREPMTRQLFAESVCKTGKSSHLHSDRQVVSLRVTRADVLNDRMAKDRLTASTDALIDGVTSEQIALVAVKLDEHPIINRLADKCGPDRDQIRAVAIRGELDAVTESGREVPQERVCARGTPVTNEPRGNQFRFRVNGNPSPSPFKSTSLAC